MTLGALIGAGSYAIGASARSVLTVSGSLFKPSRSEQNARSLAMVTVLALDDYVGACFAAVHDKPEFNPAEEIEFAFHVPEPVLALPKDVNWQLLGTELGEEIQWFSNRVSNLENALDSLDLSKSSHDGFFERRVAGYTQLAVRAMDLITLVCEKFGLVLPEKPDFYNQADRFARILQNVQGPTGAKTDARGAVQADADNVTPLFPKTS
nr:hypothetical protein [Rhizobium cellulosilyticum]